AKHKLSSLIIEFKDDVLAEILQRNFRTKACTELPHLIGPFLEFRVVSNTALKRDRLEFGKPGRFATGAGIAAFAMMNDFCGASQAAYFADASNVLAVPFNTELKILVGIKTVRINSKLSHSRKVRDTKTSRSCQRSSRSARGRCLSPSRARTNRFCALRTSRSPVR